MSDGIDRQIKFRQRQRYYLAPSEVRAITVAMQNAWGHRYTVIGRPVERSEDDDIQWYSRVVVVLDKDDMAPGKTPALAIARWSTTHCAGVIAEGWTLPRTGLGQPKYGPWVMRRKDISTLMRDVMPYIVPPTFRELAQSETRESSRRFFAWDLMPKEIFVEGYESSSVVRDLRTVVSAVVAADAFDTDALSFLADKVLPKAQEWIAAHAAREAIEEMWNHFDNMIPAEVAP